MNKTRREAFSDGVLAIIITIMVLELKVPHGESLDVLMMAGIAYWILAHCLIVAEGPVPCWPKLCMLPSH
jgi:uncharacterized membrane protein